MRTVKFYTLGCKVNQYDTQSIREKFMQTGFQELEDGKPADFYVINTCTVTHKADSDSFGLIRKAEKENPKAKIIVTGCLTELDGDRIKNIDEACVIVKNKDKENILQSILDLTFKNLLTGQQAYRPTKMAITYFKGHTRAFLKIQDGCNNFCSYCKVPLVRGRSRSKPLNEILKEAKQLVKNGYKEIVLTGICLGEYGQDLNPKINLVDAIVGLEKIDGLLRIRLSSIEFRDISEELIYKMAQSKKLCRHLHIPIQSGDDEILKKMNRYYTSADYLNLIRKIKNNIPGIAITTDVLVGFPGETEENFQNTLNLIKTILPLKAHIFPYSKRRGTTASNFNQTINPKILKRRIAKLKNIADYCAFNYKGEFLNKKMEVLIENRHKKNLNLWQGYTDNYIKVLVKSKQELKNQLISLKLKKIVSDEVLAYFR